MDRAALVSTGELILPEPPSANRWWRNVNGRMITSKEARVYKASVARTIPRPLLRGPVHVSIDWYRGRRSGDLDKRLGVVLDALQGVLYENDSQIVELTARRFDSPGNPRIVVRVQPVGAVQESLLVGTALDPSTPDGR